MGYSIAVYNGYRTSKRESKVKERYQRKEKDRIKRLNVKKDKERVE